MNSSGFILTNSIAKYKGSLYRIYNPVVYICEQGVIIKEYVWLKSLKEPSDVIIAGLEEIEISEMLNLLYGR